MRVFDPKKVTVIYDGEVITGFAEGSMVEAEKNEDDIMPHVGVLGEVSVAINADETGTITLSLANTSPFVKILANKARAKTVAPISIIDMNDNAVNISGTEAMVLRAPNIAIGNEIEEYEVEFFVADYIVD